MALAMRTKARLRSHGLCELQVSRFGPPPKTCRFPDWKRTAFQLWTPQKVQVSRFGPPKTCRFPGLDQVSKFGGFEIWTPQNVQIWTPQKVQVSRFGSPNVQVSRLGPPPQKRKKNVQVSRFGPPKRAGFQVWTLLNVQVRAGFQVWTLQTCRFPGLDPPNLETCTLGGPNLETCTFWAFQTWKPAHFRGPNLETCTFGGSKPANLQTCTFGGVQTCKPANLHAWGVQTRFKPGHLHVSTLTFLGLDPRNVQVSRFGPAGFQVWTCQNEVWTPLNVQVRAGFQVWTPPQTCRFPGLDAPKHANLHVWEGPNLQTCTICGVQTWKPARFGGPNLETCTF